MDIVLDPQPLLDCRWLALEWPQPLGGLHSPHWLAALLAPGAAAPLQTDDATRAAVRDVLRHGGYKPTGRGKPSSEYLLRAVAEGTLGAINAAVDLGNAVSLHSGLPISVVDLAKAKPPLAVRTPAAGASYVFNASGQTIDVEGLVSLCDAEGPCANAVKDAQRTKTDGATTHTLFVVWGATALGDRTGRTVAWLRELALRAGAAEA